MTPMIGLEEGWSVVRPLDPQNPVIPQAKPDDEEPS